MTTIEEAFALLDPKIRKRIGPGVGIKTEFQPTPSPGLNEALGGGFPYGRQVLLWGSKSSAKSSLCLQTIGLAQKEGKLCAWVDAEMSYDEEWAKKLGVDTEKLIYSAARSINDMVDVTVALLHAGVDMIVIDSISSLLPAVYFEKDSTELKQLDQTKQIGAESKDLKHAWMMINYANNQEKPALIVAISQARNNITAMYTQSVPTGGLSTQFMSSTIVKLFSSSSDAQAIKRKIKSGDKLIESKVGRRVRWEVTNSKTSAPGDVGEYDFYYRGDLIGIDGIGDLVDTAEMRGLVERTGAWYLLPDGSKVQGRDGFIEKVRQDEELKQSLISQLNGLASE
jgi:recombination protein RecA